MLLILFQNIYKGMKSKLFFFLFIFYWPCAILATESAKPTVVLMTSIKNFRPWYKPFGQPLHLQLEAHFLNTFQNSGYKIKVIHQADPFELWQVLKSPDSVGIFWVSHSASEQTLHAGLSYADTVLDYEGNNVEALFNFMHPNLKWISLIGCYGSEIFENLNEGLFCQTFASVVGASDGLEQALEFSRGMLLNSLEVRRGYENECKRIKASPLIIRREISREAKPENILAIRVEMKDQILTVFPKGQPGDIQIETIYIPEDFFIRKSNLNIKLDSGASVLRGKENIHLGAFTFEAQWKEASWKLFADQNGEAIGVGEKIYFYTGNLPSAPYVIYHEPYECKPMAERQ